MTCSQCLSTCHCDGHAKKELPAQGKIIICKKETLKIMKYQKEREWHITSSWRKGLPERLYMLPLGS